MTTAYRSFVAQFGEIVPEISSLFEDMDDLTHWCEGDGDIHRRFRCGWSVRGDLVMPGFHLENGDEAWHLCVGRTGNRRNGSGQPEQVLVHRNFWVGYDEWIAAGKPTGPNVQRPYQAEKLVLSATVGDTSCPAHHEIETLRQAMADLKAACSRGVNHPAYDEARRLAFGGVEAALSNVVRHVTASLGLPNWLIEAPKG